MLVSLYSSQANYYQSAVKGKFNNMENEWQEFFDNHAPRYKDNVFVKNTKAEIEFLIEELKLPQGSRILDMGCGTGRHTVGLATKGYLMTGVDWSEGMLAEAAKEADRAGVDIELVREDAKKYHAENYFDAAICLCEGAFGLLLKDEDPLAHDRAILENLYHSLKPGGKLILGALNGLKKIRDAKQEDIASGKFDPYTLIETYNLEYNKPDGTKKPVTLREHGFLPGELKRLCIEVGFEVEHIWSGTAGNWQRKQIDLDEMEMMVVARRGK